MSFNGQYKILENNFIYFYHLKKYFILPIYPEQIAEQLSSKFAENNAISRSAPVFSYIQSGPRTVQISLSLHRDMFKDIPNFSELPDISKYGLTNPDNISLTGRLGSPFSPVPVGDPYIGVNISGVDSDTNKALYKFDKDAVDTLISYLQASSLPSYSNSNNIYTVTPPMVALNFGGIGDSAGKGIVIKGIINSGISVNLKKPIDTQGRYTQADVAFTVSEVDPYDAEYVAKNGSFRDIFLGNSNNFRG